MSDRVDQYCSARHPEQQAVVCWRVAGHEGSHDNNSGFVWGEVRKEREGDQVLPTGNEALVDDQQLLIDDIQERRQIGIARYGQGHRPFNGRDTLQDLYEEQLDLLVYLRSIKRMAEATQEELVEIVSTTLVRHVAYSELAAKAIAEVIVQRIMGHVAGELIRRDGRA